VSNALSHITAVVVRDLRLAMRRKADVLGTLFFFIIVVSLFPLGIGPETKLLRAIAPGILWVAALLATMLSLNRLFAADYADGTLEQLAIAPQPLTITNLGKIIALWISSGLPLIILAPILGLQFGLPYEALVTMTLALLLGTPILAALGAIGAGLTLGLRGGGVLLALLILPLYIPVLIFGAGAVEAVVQGLSPSGQLSLLAAGLILSLVFAPWASAVALRIALD
jgi:heme exporter protein B